MIKKIIPALTPNNISEIPLLKDSIDIFLTYITKHSNISIDIKNILDQDKVVIYEEFIKIYLNGIYNILNKSEHNEALFNVFKRMSDTTNISIDEIDLSIDIVKLLKQEYILTNKHYKQAKGTSSAMEYIFNIIVNSGLQSDSFSNSMFQYFEGTNPFEYTIEATIIKEIYDYYVKPLTHPVGWLCNYQRVFYQTFTDYFNLKFNYNFSENGLEVRCMSGDSLNKDDYLNNISHSGKELVQDNTVEYINTETLNNGKLSSEITTVYFKSGETLVSIDNPRSLILYKNHEILINYDNYDSNCGLYLEYSVTLTTTVSDKVKFQDISNISSTTNKKNIVGAGNVYVGATLCGDILVNKNVSVTYNSYSNKNDGTNITNSFSANDKICKNNFEIYYNFDHKINFDNFKYDVTKKLINSNLSGKIANDEFEWYQKLEICDSKVEIEDNFKLNKNWDRHRIKFDNFNYDGAYVSDDFKITSINSKLEFEDNFNLNKNWDSHRIKFDDFNYDGVYVSDDFKITSIKT